MATLAVYDIDNQKTGDMELDDHIFDAKVHPSVLHEAVRKSLASRRQGTAATKNRALVRGGGAKPWRQKGTGRARAGSRRSPVWRGGGTIFGPMPRDYVLSLPEKMRRAALRAALTMKHKEGKLILLEDFPLETFKTRQVVEVLKKFRIEDALIVIDQRRTFLERSTHNLASVKVLRQEALNVYDILDHENLILLRPALSQLQGVLS